MSNLYATEPAPNGKVIVDTSMGEIEIELWGKECPRAVRNFIQLSMEGYYDGVIFHRIVKNFIVQTGDPTGTGMGGQSIYDEPFADETHSRLKFNRRGLVGMANNGKRNTNNSQWFITLDRADELTNKHTMFGRITGPTYFNVLNIGNLDVDAEERPVVPPKITGVRVIENPFDDIVPRITAAEKREQQQARLEAKKLAEKRAKKAKAMKNTVLLSFGEAEEEDSAQVTIKKKDLGRQDLVTTSEPKEEKKKAKEAVVEAFAVEEAPEASSSKPERKAVDLKSIRAEHERQRLGDSSTRKTDIERMQDDLRMMKKRMGDDSDSDSDTSSTRRKRRKGPSALEQELAKYSKGRGRAATRHSGKGRREDDDDLMRDLHSFSKKIVRLDDDGGRGDDNDEGGDEEGQEVDDDVGWLRHALQFKQEVSDETRRAESEYTVIDARAKARELADEEQREKKEKNRARQK